jgi:alpha-beta hydrolase superfamily lysophospholipase
MLSNRLAKKASNNFKVAKDAVISTGLKFSVTGHGVGGAVAALAALEMGAVSSEPKV